MNHILIRELVFCTRKMEDSSDDNEEIPVVLDAAFMMANEIVGDGDSDSFASTTERKIKYSIAQISICPLVNP